MIYTLYWYQAIILDSSKRNHFDLFTTGLNKSNKVTKDAMGWKSLVGSERQSGPRPPRGPWGALSRVFRLNQQPSRNISLSARYYFHFFFVFPFFPFTFLVTDRMVRLKQQTGKNFSLSAKAYFQFLWSLPEKQGGFINAFLLCFMQNARRLTPCLGIVIFQRKWIQIEFFSISKQIWFNSKCKYIETSSNVYLKGNLGNIFTSSRDKKFSGSFDSSTCGPSFWKAWKTFWKLLCFISNLGLSEIFGWFSLLAAGSIDMEAVRTRQLPLLSPRSRTATCSAMQLNV